MKKLCGLIVCTGLLCAGYFGEKRTPVDYFDNGTKLVKNTSSDQTTETANLCYFPLGNKDVDISCYEQSETDETEEYFTIKYVVNQSNEEDKEQFYQNGKGTLTFSSMEPLDDWVGFGGRYVTYCTPESAIHFKLTNNGEETLENPKVKFEFTDVILKNVDEPFVGENHVHGLGGFGTAVLNCDSNLQSGTSSTDYMLYLSEAYFNNGKTGTLKITLSADNYPAKTYSVPLKLRLSESTVSFTKSTVCTLSKIACSQGKLTPKFNKNKTSYTLTLTKNMSSVIIKPTASDKAATVQINGKKVSKIKVSLKKGKSKKINIVVKAENGKKKTYKITVKRKR